MLFRFFHCLSIEPAFHIFFLGGAAPNLSWGHKGNTPARSWLGIDRATGPDPFRHCLHPNAHLHCMPQCEVTPAGFVFASIPCSHPV